MALPALPRIFLLAIGLGKQHADDRANGDAAGDDGERILLDALARGFARLLGQLLRAFNAARGGCLALLGGSRGRPFGRRACYAGFLTRLGDAFAGSVRRGFQIVAKLAHHSSPFSFVLRSRRRWIQFEMGLRAANSKTATAPIPISGAFFAIFCLAEAPALLSRAFCFEAQRVGDGARVQIVSCLFDVGHQGLAQGLA
jgi:hypothetical protein